MLFGGGDSNLYGYVLQDPVNLVDPLGLSAKDIEKMIDIMHNYVNDLVRRGLRRPGKGTWNGLWNNFSSTFGSSYLGCIDQTKGLIDILDNIPFEDEWKFYDSKPNWWHHRVKAISSNPDDPIIYLDPWRDEYEKENIK